jgi:hypothetical protein
VRLQVRVRKFFYDDPVGKRKRFVESSRPCSYGSMDEEREVTLWQESAVSIRTVRKDQ